MAKNVQEISTGIKLIPTATSPSTTESGVMYYDSVADKFVAVQSGSPVNFVGGSGVVGSGTAGDLTLYTATGTTVGDTYVQNANNIVINIAAQPTRSANLAISIPNPGDAVTAANVVLSEGTRTINGSTTFGNDLTINGNLDVKGTTTTIESTVTTIADPLITLNKGGAAASGGGSGFEIEENASITGFVKASAARTGFDIKAPATSGIATIVTPAGNQTYTLPAATGTLLTAVSQDSAPVLGGNLDVSTFAIQSTSNNNISLAPNGTGRILLNKQGALTRYVDLQYIDAITLTASTTSVASALTYDCTVIRGQKISYTITEATSNKARIGTLMVVSDGAATVASTNVSIVDTSTSTADVGVVWTAAISSNNVQLSYTTTANAKSMNVVVERFLK